MNFIHLEDSPNDALLIESMLRDTWPDCKIRRVVNDFEFEREIAAGDFDVILSDFSLPSYDGLSALKLARERCPDKPYIFISGTIGEERAIDAMRNGAADYVIKDRPGRLVPAIQHAVNRQSEADRRRKSEEARQLAEVRIRELADMIDKARDGIVVADLNDRVEFWNQGAERISGVASQDAVGKTLDAIWGRSLLEQLGPIRRSLLATGRWAGEVKIDKKGGPSQILELRSSLVVDESGQPKSRLTIVSDVTEKRQMEEKFLRVQRMESIGLLAAGIAHDLNNVLAPILMAAPLIRERSTNQADQRLLGTLERSAERGAALVRQILGFARGAGGTEKVVVQVRHLLRDIYGVMTATFPKNITFEDHFPTELWPVFANPTQVHQVLLNLCVNARDAMPRGGTLTLRAENRQLDDAAAAALQDGRPGNFVVIEVGDSGTGIPPEVLASIWEPFFTTKEVGKGTGLGLSTVKTIVTNHLGFIDLKTEVGKGTVFRVFLPTAEAAQVCAVGEHSSQTPRGNGELVLVVDDEPNIRTIVSDTLTGHGYRTIMAADGVEGVTTFAPHATEINLVVTDVLMPNLDGPAFARVIRRLNPAVKIMAMTGETENSRASAGFADAVVTKPCKPASLLSAAHELLKAAAPAPSGS